MKRIFITLTIIIGISLIASFLTIGSFWGAVMPFLGGTIGIIMGLSFPWDISFKVFYILALLLCIMAIVLGLKNHHKTIGQFFSVLGIISWCVLGIIGLGTGT